jgi:hypothetical protein
VESAVDAAPVGGDSDADADADADAEEAEAEAETEAESEASEADDEASEADEADADAEAEPSEEIEETDVPLPSNADSLRAETYRELLDAMSYQELQSVAKDVDVKANLARDEMTERIMDEFESRTDDADETDEE